MKRLRWIATVAVLALAVGSFPPGATPQPLSATSMNQHGLTGSWYQPAMSGQGIELEVYQDAIAPGIGFLQGSWATHKPIGYWDYDWEHRWYTFGGNAPAGQSSATFTLYKNVGGNFNALPVTSGVAVGTVTLRFHDCANAMMEYAFTDDGYRSGVIPLVRLTPNVTCSASGETLIDTDFAYSGNWFNPGTSGQGFIFELNPNAAVVFFGWFTYAPGGQSQGAAGQRWYTGQASYIPGSRTLPVTLYETLGNSFDSDDPRIHTFTVGSATVTFLSCHAATLTFTITSGGNAAASGTINLSRVGPTPPGCGA